VCKGAHMFMSPRPAGKTGRPAVPAELAQISHSALQTACMRQRSERRSIHHAVDHKVQKCAQRSSTSVLQCHAAGTFPHARNAANQQGSPPATCWTIRVVKVRYHPAPTILQLSCWWQAVACLLVPCSKVHVVFVVAHALSGVATSDPLSQLRLSR
jgi:hypothetical protein